tara:strand:- start:1836 stop:1949 length:114 start_codon:yes stop_codon:yes gene_type:complete
VTAGVKFIDAAGSPKNTAEISKINIDRIFMPHNLAKL